MLIILIILGFHALPEKHTEHVSVKPRSTTNVQPKVTPKPVIEKPVEVPPPTQPIIVAEASGPTQWMDAAGISESDRSHVQAIMGQESGWRLASKNYLGCIGLGQACPAGNKAEMLSKCPDWETNGGCQMNVWKDYMLRRYGSWAYAEEWKFCTAICYNSHTGATVNKHGEPWW